MSELKRAIEEHKKCPCCDSKCVSCGSFIDRNKEEIYIRCNSCGLKIQLAKEYGWEELLKRWNTRKPLQNIVERLEEELRLAEEERDRCPIKALPYYDSVKGYANGVHNAIEIVKEKGGV